MKIGGNFQGFNISAEGLSVQRKKMNLIAENIANVDSVRAEDGQAYQRKYLKIVQQEKIFSSGSAGNQNVRLASTRADHIRIPFESVNIKIKQSGFSSDELIDLKPGEQVYMPENPTADNDGYVEMSNVNIINEMTDMIAASRSYEANLTALNASKQIAKDSLDI